MARPSKLIPFPSRVVPDPGAQGIISPNLTGGNLPRLDTSAAIAPAQGMADAGKGVQQLGGAMGALAEKMEQSDTTTAEHALALKMDQTRYNIAAATIKERDRSKWDGIADSMLSQLAEEAKNLPNVPESARKLLDYKMAQFGVDIRGGLKVHAAEKSIGDARSSIDAVIAHAGATGQEALGETTIDGAVAAGYYPKEVGEKKKDDLRKDVEQFQTNQKKQQFLSAVQADPEAALKIARDPAYNVKPDFRAWAEHTGVAAVRAATADTINELDSHVQSGEFVSVEQVDAYKEKNPKITDEMANNAKKNVRALNSAAHQQWKIDNSDTNISRAMSAVRGYDPKADSDDLKEFDRINTWIARNLVPGDKGVAETALRAKLANKAVETEKDPVLKDVIKDLDGMTDRGDFGGYTTKRIETVETDGVKHTATVTDVDYQRKAAAEDARIKVEAHLRAFKKANPKASYTDLMTEIGRVKPAAQSAVFIDNLRDSTGGGVFAIPQIYGPPLPKGTSAMPPVPLPEDPGRAPKAKPVEDDNEDKTPKGSADVGNADLFPVGEGGNIVGGGNILLDKPLPEDSRLDSLPPDPGEKKRKKR